MIQEIWVELLIGVGIPAIGAGAFAVRYYITKNKCFYLMKQRLEQLETEVTRSKDRDVDIFARLNIIDQKNSNVEGKLDILISKIK